MCCFLAGRTAGKLQAAFVPAAQMTVEEAKLAVIIDDFGYNGAGTAEMLALDIPFTAAVLPFSSHTAENAEQAKAAGKEVIIHMPMESLTGKPEWVGDGAVCRGMSAAEVRQCMEAAYCAVPQAAGVNNHMGSAVMEDANTLGCVLDVVREKGGVFVDSVTTAQSKCGTLAGEKGVKLLERVSISGSTNGKKRGGRTAPEAETLPRQRKCRCHRSCGAGRGRIDSTGFGGNGAGTGKRRYPFCDGIGAGWQSLK